MKNHYSMKTFQTLIFCFLSMGLFAQTFVKQDAGGNNNGTSWADAFTDFQTALDNTASGDIWVAAGTYTPVSVDTNSTFRLSNPVAIYGGFNGTETTLDERDPGVNITTFSGDVNGDDAPGNTFDNRTDNTRHIIYVDSLLSGATVFDGLNFSGGHTGDNGDLNLWHRAGGAIFSYSRIQIENCVFSDNFGRSGGSVYIFEANGNGSSCKNSAFSNNRTSSQSAGLMANQVEGLIVENCDFVGNSTVRGALYTLNCTNAFITNSRFTGNSNTTGFGGAYFNWNSQNVTLEDCQFTQNSANNAGAIYHDGRNLDFETPLNFVLRNCSFTGNSAVNSTGAMQNWQGSITIENCQFVDNSSGDSGGTLSLSAANETVIITGSSFENSQCGGAHSAYGENANYQISNCSYIKNTSGELGGAVNCGFRANVLFDNCLFQENATSTSAGGAVAMQNDSTSLTVLNSNFLNNTSFSSSGGAIHGNDSHVVTVDNCYFEANNGNFGGAINLTENSDEPGDDMSNLMVCNSEFNFNFANQQGGAISTVNNNVTIYNSAFYNNIASDPGTGGAFSFNTADNNFAICSILNSTFADNSGTIGGAISNWTGTIDATSTMTIQNTLFRGDGIPNYMVEDGTPDLVSNGGNWLDDDTFDDATIASDIVDDGGDPKFVNPDDFDYSLTGGSPCVNAGVDTGAPEFDINGTPRFGQVDIGAYEFDPTSVKETVLNNDGMLNIFPNPVHDVTKIELDNDWNGDLEIRIYNVLGQESMIIQTSKISRIHQLEFDVTELRNGVYDVMISNGAQAVVQKLTKF